MSNQDLDEIALQRVREYRSCFKNLISSISELVSGRANSTAQVEAIMQSLQENERSLQRIIKEG